MIFQSGIDKILITYKEGKTITLANDVFTISVGDGVLQIHRPRYPDATRFISLANITGFTIHRSSKEGEDNA